MLYTVNSYYSNKIESEETHIIDIERAMQKECEKYFSKNPHSSAYEKEFILGIPKSFYSKEGMEPFLDIRDKNITEELIPGALRQRDVKVGNHIAPYAKEVDTLMNEFEHLYNKSLKKSDFLCLFQNKYKRKTELNFNLLCNHCVTKFLYN